MKVGNSGDEFFEEIAGHRFIELAASSDIVKHITSCTKVHEKEVVMFGLDVLEHLNDVRVTEAGGLEHELFVENS